MNTGTGTSYERTAASAQPLRERDQNCIEMHLKNIEAELSEALNSAENLADKLSGDQGKQGKGGEAPALTDVQSRLGQIVNTVRYLNQQLGRAQSAVSG